MLDIQKGTAVAPARLPAAVHRARPPFAGADGTGMPAVRRLRAGASPAGMSGTGAFRATPSATLSGSPPSPAPV